MAEQKQKASMLYNIILLIWAILLVLAWVLILVGMIHEDGLVEGKTGNRQVDVGLFKQCENVDDSGSSCKSVDFSDINIDMWHAAAVFLVLELITVPIAIALILASICSYTVLPYAKWVQAFANLWLMIAIILIPLGFAYLDDSCPDSDGFEAQCALPCTDESDEFKWFTLCHPYGLGAGLITMLVGIFLQFLSSFFAVCVQLRREVQETYTVSN